MTRQDLLDGVEQIALALRSFHDSHTELPTSFRVPDLLEDYAAIVRRRGGTLPGAYSGAVFAAARIAAALPVRRTASVSQRPARRATSSASPRTAA